MMRLRSLHLHHFGIFRDQALTLPDTSPVIFLGDNEAGKSTFLAALRALLFGLPDRRQSRERVYPASGPVVGELVLETDARTIRLERRTGRSGGPLHLCDGSGTPLPDQALTTALGGLNRTAFRTMHAFSLDELQSFDTLTDDELQGALSAAASGTDPERLRAAEKTLRERAAEIFRPRGQKPDLNAVLARIETLRNDIRSQEPPLETYAHLTAQCERIGAELTDARTEQARLAEAVAQAQDDRKAWAAWVGLQRVEQAIKGHDTALSALPADALTRFEKHQQAARRGCAERQELDEQLDQLQARLREAPVDTALLDAADAIQDLAEGRSRYTECCADMSGLATHRQACEKELADALALLGPEWTAERVADLDRSVAQHTRCRQFVARFDDQERRHRTATERAESAAAEHDAIAKRAEELRQTVAAGPGPGLPDDLDALREVREIARELRSLEARILLYEDDRRQSGTTESLARWSVRLDSPRALVAAGAVGALLIGGMALIGFSRSAYIAMGAVAGVAFGVGGLHLLRKLLAPIRTESDRRQADLDAAHQEAARVRLRLEAAGLADLPAETIEDRIADASTAHQAQTRRLEEVEADLNGAAQRLAQYRQVATADARQHAELQEEWRQLLRAQHLPDDLSPDSALRFLEVADSAHRAAQKLDEARAAHNRAVEFSRDYQERVTQLFARLERPPPKAGMAGHAMAALDRERAEHESRKRLADERTAHIAELGRKRVRRDRERAVEETAVAELLDAAGVTDEQGFREVFRQCEEFRRNRIERDKHLAALQAVYGGHAQECAAARLAEATEGTLDTRLRELRAQLQETEERCNELRTRETELGVELARLRDDDTLAQLNLDLQAAREDAARLAREWLECSVAQHLVATAKRRFEEERQPEVLRVAARYFQRMTGGAYTKAVAELDDRQALSVVDASGVRHTISELSRGTAEQLYLALRFGFLAAASTQREAIPVLMDDILVNFDPTRECLAVRAIAEFAATRQVLYFTCHPETVERFRTEVPGLAGFRLVQGQFEAM